MRPFAKFVFGGSPLRVLDRRARRPQFRFSFAPLKFPGSWDAFGFALADGRLEWPGPRPAAGIHLLYAYKPSKGARFQNGARPLLVPRHFGDERVQGLELELVPDALDELNVHLAAVKVAVKIEKMNF